MLTRTSCCGVRDYEGVQERTAVEVMRDLYLDFYNVDNYHDDNWSSGAFVLFTCPAEDRKIPRLIEYIEEHKLGSCTLAPTAKNPNSDRNLQAMLFGVDHRAYHEWHKRFEGVQVGSQVINGYQDSLRYGEEATVTGIEDGVIFVRYTSGAAGKGLSKHYQLVD